MSDPLERQEHLHRLVSVLGFLEYRAVGAFHDGVRADDHERRGLLLLQPRRDLHRFVRRRRGGVFGATGERGFIQIFVEIGNDDVELQPLRVGEAELQQFDNPTRRIRRERRHRVSLLTRLPRISFRRGDADARMRRLAHSASACCSIILLRATCGCARGSASLAPASLPKTTPLPLVISAADSEISSLVVEAQPQIVITCAHAARSVGSKLRFLPDFIRCTRGESRYAHAIRERARGEATRRQQA